MRIFFNYFFYYGNTNKRRPSAFDRGLSRETSKAYTLQKNGADFYFFFMCVAIRFLLGRENFFFNFVFRFIPVVRSRTRSAHRLHSYNTYIKQYRRNSFSYILRLERMFIYYRKKKSIYARAKFTTTRSSKERRR